MGLAIYRAVLFEFLQSAAEYGVLYRRLANDISREPQDPEQAEAMQTMAERYLDLHLFRRCRIDRHEMRLTKVDDHYMYMSQSIHTFLF